MADLFERGDALGPVKVVHVCEPSMGQRAVLVIDSVAVARVPPRQAAMRLAGARVEEAMSYRRFRLM